MHTVHRMHTPLSYTCIGIERDGQTEGRKTERLAERERDGPEKERGKFFVPVLLYVHRNHQPY